MTTPHAVVDAIVARLQTVLNPGASAPAYPIRVFAHDGRFGADGKNNVTTSDPGVLVFCHSWATDDEFQPPRVMGRFVAVCVSRTPRAASGKDTMGDVAMDLAATVHAVLEAPAGEFWSSLATQRPEGVRAVNEYTNGLADKGLSMWSVEWRQQFELTSAETQTSALLERIHFTLAGGPSTDIDTQLADDTPDIEAEVEFT